MGQEFNVLALIKGAEHYVYIYDDDSRETLLEAFRDQAGNGQLSLSWFDVAVLTQKAREQARTAPGEPPSAGDAGQGDGEDYSLPSSASPRPRF